MKKQYKIVIAGTGYVGLVTGVCFAEKGHTVLCVDIDENRIQMMKEGISPIYEENLEKLMKNNYKKGKINYTTDYKLAYKEADIIFVCVGTPELPDGLVNLKYIETVSKQIAENIKKNCLIVIKSTVPIGTSKKVEQIIKKHLINNVKVEIASNPEFLSQGSAVRDTLKAKRIVIGTESKDAERKLLEIYKPFNIPIVSVSIKSSEMIKYASNGFLALKISYMNEIAKLCELSGANIEEVENGMSYDTRIGKDFLKAGIGYGGSCLPKDTKALKSISNQYGYKFKTIEAAIDVNIKQKTELLRKAKEKIRTFKGLKVAVLGLTFKPKTDDLREAPSLENIEILLKEGANIYAYDPIGEENCKKIYSTEIKYVKTPKEALNKADICFIFTEWDEIKKIKPIEYKELMNRAIVYDGRNIYKVKEMLNQGIEYYSVGRI